MRSSALPAANTTGHRSSHASHHTTAGNCVPSRRCGTSPHRQISASGTRRSDAGSVVAVEAAAKRHASQVSTGRLDLVIANPWPNGLIFDPSHTSAEPGTS